MTQIIWFWRDGTECTKQVRNVKGHRAVAPQFVPCGRCGGAGGADKWRHTGWTCFQCQGHKGHMGLAPVYTAEKLEKLNVARTKARAKAEAKREAASEAKKVQAKADAAAWREAHPAELLALEEYKGHNPFLAELLEKLDRWGSLSDRQVAAIPAAVERAKQRIKEETAPEWADTDDRQTVSGTILTVKDYPSSFGYNQTDYKMLVRLEDGRKCWGSVPAKVWEATREIQEGGDTNGADGMTIAKGLTVTFTAKFNRKPDDKRFAYYKRPTKVVAERKEHAKS